MGNTWFDTSSWTENLRKLLRKGVRFEWTEAHQQEFDEVKAILSAAPLVCHPSPDLQMNIVCDASTKGLGAMLYQTGPAGPEDIRVIAYYSRACTAAEQNYDARELETLALLSCLEKWKCYIPRDFTVLTDHANLLHLNSYVKHKTRLSSWSNRMSVFNPTIKHIAGNENLVADWLSRNPVVPSHLGPEREGLK